MNRPTELLEKIREAVADTGAERITNYELAILHGLQFKQTYQGTVPTAVIRDRRKFNKCARAARRHNRRR